MDSVRPQPVSCPEHKKLDVIRWRLWTTPLWCGVCVATGSEVRASTHCGAQGPVRSEV